MCPRYALMALWSLKTILERLEDKNSTRLRPSAERYGRIKKITIDEHN